MSSCNFTNKANSHTPKVEIHTTPKLCHFGHVPFFFVLVTDISVAKTEISVIEPARLLIWTHRNVYEGKREEARSWNRPSQPEWPSSYEDTISRSVSPLFETSPAMWRAIKNSTHGSWSPGLLDITFRWKDFFGAKQNWRKHGIFN